ncbi:MAG: ATP-binding protein involved in chromosome partitioning, partial [Ulvibacter sp.]
MKINKQDILNALKTITVAGEGKNMVDSGQVKNVVTFADEVIVDLVLTTPALHIKKRAETDVEKVIQEKVFKDA